MPNRALSHGSRTRAGLAFLCRNQIVSSAIQSSTPLILVGCATFKSKHMSVVPTIHSIKCGVSIYDVYKLMPVLFTHSVYLQAGS